LIELLDPSTISHYEFFLVRPPIPRQTWEDDNELRQAIPEPNPCLENWHDSPQFFNPDYQVVKLSPAEWQFLLSCDANQANPSKKNQGDEPQPKQIRTVGELLSDTEGDMATVRSLQRQQLILLTPSSANPIRQN